MLSFFQVPRVLYLLAHSAATEAQPIIHSVSVEPSLPGSCHTVRQMSSMPSTFRFEWDGSSQYMESGMFHIQSGWHARNYMT